MPNSNPLSQALNKAIGKMLKPLVKLLMHKGITYIGLQELLKETYVEVADLNASFQLNNKRQTDSRISLLTGVHRKEVKRIREAINTTKTEKEIKASISAQMMAKWLGHPNFIDEQGEPKALHKQHDTALSFSDLVFSVSKDKHPRSILDDWLQQGFITIDKEQLIWLNKEGYAAPEDMEEKLFFAGKNIEQHLTTVTHNLTSNNTPLFDRAVYYHQLSENSALEIETLSKALLLETLKTVNKKAAQLQQQDADQAELTQHSIHIGAYFAKDDKQGDK